MNVRNFPREECIYAWRGWIKPTIFSYFSHQNFCAHEKFGQQSLTKAILLLCSNTIILWNRISQILYVHMSLHLFRAACTVCTYIRKYIHTYCNNKIVYSKNRSMNSAIVPHMQYWWQEFVQYCISKWRKLGSKMPRWLWLTVCWICHILILMQKCNVCKIFFEWTDNCISFA